MQYIAQDRGSSKILVTVVATQELKDGDVLRRFKADVSQDEPRRGNNTNRHTRSTSAQCLEIMSVYGIPLTFFGVFIFFDDTCVCVCVCVFVCAVFPCDVLCFIQDKVTAFAC